MTKDSVNIAARAYLILVVLVVEDGASIFRTTASVSKIPKQGKIQYVIENEKFQ